MTAPTPKDIDDFWFPDDDAPTAKDHIRLWNWRMRGGPPGANRIEGIGMGFVVPLWKPDLVDEIIPVSASDAMAMSRRLAREEGVFAGASSGANVVAALRLAERLGPDATVVTLMIDTGIKYLSTEVYKEL